MADIVDKVRTNRSYSKPRYDYVAAIIDYESGELSEEDTITLFQYLVDTGLAWSLQGHYGRVASAMLESGDIVRK